MCSKVDGNLVQSNSDVDQRDTIVESQPHSNAVNHSEPDAELNLATIPNEHDKNGSHSSVESNQSMYPWESSDENNKTEKQQLQPLDIEFLSVSDISAGSTTSESCRLSGRLSDRVKRKSWYNIIYPTYKARSETFKRLFSEVPDNERLIVDYSCALQREILAHGRMFVSQHYLCFHANIFGWETFLSLKWRDVTALTKEKTALVIPNAILVSTKTEKYFITSFAARDKTYLQLFRIWQNALLNKSMVAQEIWQTIHNAYGDQLGLTSDDEDYIDPSNNKADNSTGVPTSEKTKIKSKSKSKSTKSECAAAVAFADKNHKTCADGSDNDNFELSRDSDWFDSADSNAMNSAGGSIVSTKSKMRIMRSKAELLTNENIPTDVSDSTDDETSVPFVSTAECTSMHDGRQVVHTILPINVDSLMSLLFSKSKFFGEFHAMRKTTNMQYRDWVVADDGLKTRTMNFTVAVTQAVGPKTCNVTEIQKMRECTVPGELYSIDITSINAGIPYADSFQVLFHYCLVRTVDDHTMLSVYAQIKYVKSVWGVVKGFIEKNIWCGLEDFYKALLNALQSEYCIPPAKSKSRRTKRAMTQKTIVEEAPIKMKFASTATSHSMSSDAMSPLIATKLTSQCAKSPSLPIVEPPRSHLQSSIFMEHFTIFIVIVIIGLTLLNIYLITKLYMIESSGSINSFTTTTSSSSSAAAGEQRQNEIPLASGQSIRGNWLDVLSEQDAIPDAEMTKWQEFIAATIQLLQKIENIYTGLSLQLNSTTTGGHNNAKDEF